MIDPLDFLEGQVEALVAVAVAAFLCRYDPVPFEAHLRGMCEQLPSLKAIGTPGINADVLKGVEDVWHRLRDREIALRLATKSGTTTGFRAPQER